MVQSDGTTGRGAIDEVVSFIIFKDIAAEPITTILGGTMSLQTLLLFIPACFALNMAFGPNNLLSLMNGARHGATPAIVASVGRLIAFLIMIVIAAVGLGALLMTSEVLFSVVKWVGAAYLVWLGMKVFVTKSPTQSASPTPNSDYSLLDYAVGRI